MKRRNLLYLQHPAVWTSIFVLVLSIRAFAFTSWFNNLVRLDHQRQRHQHQSRNSGNAALQLKPVAFDTFENSIDGFDRLNRIYTDWCQNHGFEYDGSRLEIFSYHFLLAESHSQNTGTELTMNEYADLTALEYKRLKETGASVKEVRGRILEPNTAQPPPRAAAAPPTMATTTNANTQTPFGQQQKTSTTTNPFRSIVQKPPQKKAPWKPSSFVPTASFNSGASQGKTDTPPPKKSSPFSFLDSMLSKKDNSISDEYPKAKVAAYDTATTPTFPTQKQEAPPPPPTTGFGSSFLNSMSSSTNQGSSISSNGFPKVANDTATPPPFPTPKQDASSSSPGGFGSSFLNSMSSTKQDSPTSSFLNGISSPPSSSVNFNNGMNKKEDSGGDAYSAQYKSSFPPPKVDNGSPFSNGMGFNGNSNNNAAPTPPSPSSEPPRISNPFSTLNFGQTTTTSNNAAQSSNQGPPPTSSEPPRIPNPFSTQNFGQTTSNTAQSSQQPPPSSFPPLNNGNSFPGAGTSTPGIPPSNSAATTNSPWSQSTFGNQNQNSMAAGSFTPSPSLPPPPGIPPSNAATSNPSWPPSPFGNQNQNSMSAGSSMPPPSLPPPPGIPPSNAATSNPPWPPSPFGNQNTVPGGLGTPPPLPPPPPQQQQQQQQQQQYQFGKKPRAPILDTMGYEYFARQRAVALGIDIRRVRGTGHAGRVMVKDVLAAAASTEFDYTYDENVSQTQMNPIVGGSISSGPKYFSSFTPKPKPSSSSGATTSTIGGSTTPQLPPGFNANGGGALTTPLTTSNSGIAPPAPNSWPGSNSNSQTPGFSNNGGALAAPLQTGNTGISPPAQNSWPGSNTNGAAPVSSGNTASFGSNPFQGGNTGIDRNNGGAQDTSGKGLDFPTSSSLSPNGGSSSSGRAPGHVFEPNVDYRLIEMPSFSRQMTHGKIVKWLKREGEDVKANEPIVLVKDDDNQIIPIGLAWDSFLAASVVEQGIRVKVGTPLAFMVTNKEDIPVVKKYAASGAVPQSNSATNKKYSSGSFSKDGKTSFGSFTGSFSDLGGTGSPSDDTSRSPGMVPFTATKAMAARLHGFPVDEPQNNDLTSNTGAGAANTGNSAAGNRDGWDPNKLDLSDCFGWSKPPPVSVEDQYKSPGMIPFSVTANIAKKLKEFSAKESMQNGNFDYTYGQSYTSGPENSNNGGSTNAGQSSTYTPYNDPTASMSPSDMSRSPGMVPFTSTPELARKLQGGGGGNTGERSKNPMSPEITANNVGNSGNMPSLSKEQAARSPGMVPFTATPNMAEKSRRNYDENPQSQGSTNSGSQSPVNGNAIGGDNDGIDLSDCFGWSKPPPVSDAEASKSPGFVPFSVTENIAKKLKEKYTTRGSSENSFAGENTVNDYRSSNQAALRSGQTRSSQTPQRNQQTGSTTGFVMKGNLNPGARGGNSGAIRGNLNEAGKQESRPTESTRKGGELFTEMSEEEIAKSPGMIPFSMTPIIAKNSRESNDPLANVDTNSNDFANLPTKTEDTSKQGVTKVASGGASPGSVPFTMTPKLAQESRQDVGFKSKDSPNPPTKSQDNSTPGTAKVASGGATPGSVPFTMTPKLAQESRQDVGFKSKDSPNPPTKSKDNSTPGTAKVASGGATPGSVPFTMTPKLAQEARQDVNLNSNDSANTRTKTKDELNRATNVATGGASPGSVPFRMTPKLAQESRQGSGRAVRGDAEPTSWSSSDNNSNSTGARNSNPFTPGGTPPPNDFNSGSMRSFKGSTPTTGLRNHDAGNAANFGNQPNSRDVNGPNMRLSDVEKKAEDKFSSRRTKFGPPAKLESATELGTEKSGIASPGQLVKESRKRTRFGAPGDNDSMQHEKPPRNGKRIFGKIPVHELFDGSRKTNKTTSLLRNESSNSGLDDWIKRSFDTGPAMKLGRVSVEDVESDTKIAHIANATKYETTISLSIPTTNNITMQQPKVGSAPFHFSAAATREAQEAAKKAKIDIQTIPGTGKLGHVTLDDVKAAVSKTSVGNATSSTKLASRFASANVTIPNKASVGNATESKELASGYVSANVTIPKESRVGNATKSKELASGYVSTNVTIPNESSVGNATENKRPASSNVSANDTIPTFTVNADMRMNAFEAIYKKELKPKGISPAAMLAKSVALALEKHPVINNAYSTEDGILVNKDISVSMAVAAGGGLVTPTLVYANKRGISDLSKDWKQLVVKAKTGELASIECEFGTFTISNKALLGDTSVESMLPPGQGGILVVGATRSEAINATTSTGVGSKPANGKKQATTQRMVTMTATFDGRLVSEKDASEFLKTLRDVIENQMAIVGGATTK